MLNTLFSLTVSALQRGARNTVRYGPAIVFGLVVAFVVYTPVVLLFGGEKINGLLANRPQPGVCAGGVGWAAGTLGAIVLGWR